MCAGVNKIRNLLLILFSLISIFSYADENLGQMYLEQAKKIEVIPQESLSLYIKAAYQNNLEAQLRLMRFYETGEFNSQEYFQKPNLKSACIWAYFASKNNNKNAIEKLQTLKQLYLQDPNGTSGKGGYEVKKEIPSTEDLLKLANQGEINAQIDLSYRYLLGINTNEDRVTGLFWFLTAQHANSNNISLNQIYMNELSADGDIFSAFSSQTQRDAAQKLSTKWITEFNRKNPKNNIFQNKDSEMTSYSKKEIKSEKANPPKEIKTLDMAGAKIKCKDLGFKIGTEKFGSCVLELTK